MPNQSSTSPAEETLDLTELHPNVRQSIDLDFAGKQNGAKRTILAFLGQTPEVEVELTDIIESPDVNYDRLSVRRNTQQLEALSSFFRETYGWKVSIRSGGNKTVIRDGKKRSIRTTYCKLSITRQEFIKRRCPLFEDHSKIDRNIATPFNALEKAMEQTGTQEISLESPVDLEKRLTKAALLLALDEQGIQVLKKITEGTSDTTPQAISTKHIRAELDIPGQEFDEQITQILAKRLINRFRELGVGIVSAKNGYLAPFFSTFEPSASLKEILTSIEEEAEPERKVEQEEDREADKDQIIAELKEELEKERARSERYRSRWRKIKREVSGLRARISFLEEKGPQANLLSQIDRLEESLENQRRRSHRLLMRNQRRETAIKRLQSGAPIIALQERLDEKEEVIQDLKTRIAEFRSQITEAQRAQRKAEEVAKRNLAQEAIEELEDKLATARSDRDRYRSQARHRKEKIRDLETKIGKIERRTGTPISIESVAAMAEKNAEVQRLKLEIERLKAQPSDSERTAQLRMKIKSLKTQLGNNSKETHELEAKLARALQDKDTALKRVRLLTSDLQRAANAPKIEAEARQAKAERDRALAELRRLLEEQGDLTEEIRQLQSENEILKIAINKTVRKMQSMCSKDSKFCPLDITPETTLKRIVGLFKKD